MSDPRRRATGRTFQAWLREREPAVPAPFVGYLLEKSGAPLADGAPPMEALLGEAREALADALAESGERRGAFRLLAADAYLTYACEIALESAEPTSELLRTVDCVVGEAG